MKTVINKNMKSIVIVSAVAAILLGMLLILISGNETPGEAGQATEVIATDIGEESETKESKETTEAETTAENNGVSKRAGALFAAKAESISDGAEIAKLAETMKLEENIAGYTMQLQEKEPPKTITITFDTTVKEKNRIKFDEKVQGYAQVLLALVADADKVEWVYRVKKEDKKKEEVTVFLKTEDAGKLLNNDIKAYGKSERGIQRLLDEL